MRRTSYSITILLTLRRTGLDSSQDPSGHTVLLLTGDFANCWNPLQRIDIVTSASTGVDLLSVKQQILTGLTIDDITVGSEDGVSFGTGICTTKK